MSNYIETVKNEITIWEAAGPSFLSNAGEMILWPAQKAAEAILSDEVFNKAGQAVQTLLAGLNSTANYTINDIEIKARVAENLKAFKDELGAVDETARHYWNWHIAYAAGEGAFLGSGGIASLAADIPVILGMTIRLIQEIAICYGFEISSENEKEYIMHVLRAGAELDAKSKIEFITSLKKIEAVLIKAAKGKMDASHVGEEIKAIALLTSSDEFAEKIGIQITKRKALQMVPLLGGLVGGCFNATFINDVGQSAFMNYRRRWIAMREN